MKTFFAHSDILDYEVLRPLSHMKGNWELTWDAKMESYREEEDSYAAILNDVIHELEDASPPAKYHDSEDRLAEFVKKSLKWKIYKKGPFWIGADYDSILEQGGFDDVNEKNLILACAGRMKAAIKRKQFHYDDMEASHRRMLGAVLSIILYHRENNA